MNWITILQALLTLTPSEIAVVKTIVDALHVSHYTTPVIPAK